LLDITVLSGLLMLNMTLIQLRKYRGDSLNASEVRSLKHLSYDERLAELDFLH